MKILDAVIGNEELKKLAEAGFGDMIKGVVDVKRGNLAVDAELHSDLEALLLENGSSQNDLWGINLYPGLQGDDFLEFDSMINIRPSRGNMSRGVDDRDLQREIIEVVGKWIKR